MNAGHVALDLVIQTASGVLTGRFGAREAVTLLASQAPQARGEARRLAEHDPDRCRAYAELLGSIGEAVTARSATGQEVRDLRAVVRELERVAQVLTSPGD